MLPTEAVESIQSLRGQVEKEIRMRPGTGWNHWFVLPFCNYVETGHALPVAHKLWPDSDTCRHTSHSIIIVSSRYTISDTCRHTSHNIRHVSSHVTQYQNRVRHMSSHVPEMSEIKKNKSIRRHYSSPRFVLGIHTTSTDPVERRTSVNGNIAHLTRF